MSRHAPRHYPTPESRRALRRETWNRAWLLLGEQMERGNPLAGDVALALVETAPDLTELAAA